MKCVKNKEGKIKRVSDFLAAELVDNQKYKYCSRSEWKEKVRDKGQKE